VITFVANIADMENYRIWSRIAAVISYNMTPEMVGCWKENGYEGLFDLVEPRFGMNRMYRNNNGDVAFEFTPEQWTWFALRWL